MILIYSQGWKNQRFNPFLRIWVNFANYIAAILKSWHRIRDVLIGQKEFWEGQASLVGLVLSDICFVLEAVSDGLNPKQTLISLDTGKIYLIPREQFC